jgi:hypothetical protein
VPKSDGNIPGHDNPEYFPHGNPVLGHFNSGLPGLDSAGAGFRLAGRAGDDWCI